MDATPTRRSVLVAAGAAGLLVVTPGMAAAGQVRLTLPRPTGAHRIGTRSLHLVDRSRRDPWSARARELMISLWYPATAGHRRAPWLTPAAAKLYRRQTSEGIQTSLARVEFPVTHGHRNAPVKPCHGGYPVVLFSPGYGAMRAFGTALVEDLASRGHVVVTIDHTYEAQMVEFPGGRLELSRQPERPSDDDFAKALRVRQDDTRFVLDELASPGPLRESLDLSKIGMFGHSFGGDTAAETMAEDSRILAGVDLDGSITGAVAATGLDRPFMLMASAGHGRDTDPSWEQFWSNLRGWRRQLLLRDAGHQAYTDLAPLVQQLVKALLIPPEVVAALTESIGTINADRAVRAQRSYLGAFFDLHLRHRDNRLLSGPSPRYPEIEFVP